MTTLNYLNKDILNKALIPILSNISSPLLKWQKKKKSKLKLLELSTFVTNQNSKLKLSYLEPPIIRFFVWI